MLDFLDLMHIWRCLTLQKKTKAKPKSETKTPWPQRIKAKRIFFKISVILLFISSPSALYFFHFRLLTIHPNKYFHLLTIHPH